MDQSTKELVTALVQEKFKMLVSRAQEAEKPRATSGSTIRRSSFSKFVVGTMQSLLDDEREVGRQLEKQAIFSDIRRQFSIVVQR